MVSGLSKLFALGCKSSQLGKAQMSYISSSNNCVTVSFSLVHYDAWRPSRVGQLWDFGVLFILLMIVIFGKDKVLLLRYQART